MERTHFNPRTIPSVMRALELQAYGGRLLLLPELAELLLPLRSILRPLAAPWVDRFNQILAGKPP